MPWTEIAVWCGWLGCTLSAAFALPQAIRLLRIENTTGVALLPWQALLAANLAWSVYGAITAQPPLLISYCIAAILALFVITRLSLQAPRRVTINLSAPIALGLAMLLALPLPILFGLITIVPGTIGWLTQLRHIRRHGCPEGLSGISIILYLLCTSVWLAYALMIGDVALGASAIPLLVVITATLAVSISAGADREASRATGAL